MRIRGTSVLGVYFLTGTEIFLLATEYSPLLGPDQPPVSISTGGSFPRLDLLDYGADHASLLSAALKNMVSYTSTPSWRGDRSRTGTM
jgi:hypothetical protein